MKSGKTIKFIFFLPKVENPIYISSNMQCIPTNPADLYFLYTKSLYFFLYPLHSP